MFRISRLLPAGLAGAILIATIAASGGVLTRDTTPHAQAAPAAQERPGNDAWLFRWPLTPPLSPPSAGILPFDGAQSTVGTTLEPGETSPCAPITSSVWYSFYAETSGNIVIDTFGSSYDTAVAVYRLDPNGTVVPSPPGAQLQSLGCANQPGGEEVSFTAVPGTEYWVQFGAIGATGTLEIHADCRPACPPRNDNRANADYVYTDVYAPVWTASIATDAASVETNEPRPCGDIGATVWYHYSPQSDTDIVIDTAGSGFAAVVAVYEEGFIIPSPPGGLGLVDCDASTSSHAARLAFTTKRDRGYWIQAGGVNGSGGALRISVACATACPPYNDTLYFGYSSLPIVDTIPTTQGATLEPDEPTDCGDIGRTIWQGVYAEGNTTIVVDTAGSNFDTVIAIYRDSEYTNTYDGLEQVACASGGSGDQARIEIPAEGGFNGDPYYVQIGGRGGDFGQLVYSIDCEPQPCPPPYDSASSPNWISVPAYLPTSEGFDTRGATLEEGESQSCGNIGKTIWYYLYPEAAVDLVIDTTQSSFQTATALYRVPEGSADPLGEATQIGCSEGSLVTFAIVPTERYLVQIGGRDGASGDLIVNLSCDPACPPQNDNTFSSYYASPPADYIEDTRGATLEAGEPQPCGGEESVGHTVWFNISALPFGSEEPIDDDGEVRLTTEGSDYQTIMAVYELSGNAFSPPGGGAVFTEVACGRDVLTFTAESDRSYFVQVGGVGGASGQLRFRTACTSGACPAGFPGGAGGGPISAPDTGSGGYLPGSRAR